jgi:predicted small metal-binding protein
MCREFASAGALDIVGCSHVGFQCGFGHHAMSETGNMQKMRKMTKPAKSMHERVQMTGKSRDGLDILVYLAEAGQDLFIGSIIVIRIDRASEV